MKTGSHNAFGASTPSWNLSFPAGNLTAAEILAYLPYWLKSIDVIDRFVTNGGKANSISAMLREYRQIPGKNNEIFPPNSVLVMMQSAMRRAGYNKWTSCTHHKFKRPQPDLEGDDLNVERFRTPRITHPKSAPTKGSRLNNESDPVQFKDLAIHVKAHPIDNDALDLTRCVKYALARPEESWHFPDDFELLVNQLGGPAPVTISHLDKQAFARRSFSRQTRERKRPALDNNDIESPSRQIAAPTGVVNQASVSMAAPKRARLGGLDTLQTGRVRKSGRLANKASINFREGDSDGTGEENVDSPHSRYSTPTKKRKLSHDPPIPILPSEDGEFADDQSEPAENPIIAKLTINDPESSIPSFATHGRKAAFKAREMIRSISTETQRNIQSLKSQKPISTSTPAFTSPEESSLILEPHLEYFLYVNEDFEIVGEPGPTPVMQPYAPFDSANPDNKTETGSRMNMSAPSYGIYHPTSTDMNIPDYKVETDREMTVNVQPFQPYSSPCPETKFESGGPVLPTLQQPSARRPANPSYLRPPILHEPRLRINASNIHLYAEEGCHSIYEMWSSAFFSSRYGGPRTYEPFRELFRLTSPDLNDDSEWAENIRWAKQQYEVFGTNTWTECDSHLQHIAAYRRAISWVSEEVIMAVRVPSY